MKRFASILFCVIFCLTMCSGCCLPLHEHNYVPAETTTFPCDQGGEQLMQCECGDSYKNIIEPTEHTWDDWTEKVAPTENTEGTKVKVCSKCKAEMTDYIPRTNLDALFNKYAEFFYNRACFDSIDNLSVNDVFVMLVKHDFWGMFLWTSYDDYSSDMYYRYFHEDDLNKLTKEYFNKTYDWSKFETDENPKTFSDKLYYDTKNKCIVSSLMGGDGIGGPNYYSYEYIKYEQVDDSQYKIYYNTVYNLYDESEDDGYFSEPYPRVITVEFKDGAFQVIANQEQ